MLTQSLSATVAAENAPMASLATAAKDAELMKIGQYLRK